MVASKKRSAEEMRDHQKCRALTSIILPAELKCDAMTEGYDRDRLSINS